MLTKPSKPRKIALEKSKVKKKALKKQACKDK